ncbi:WD40 repeat domain-containing protein, partial [Endozoicomonas numazuensis]|uniref:WD40 repeat domain-containing protein n=1 Tax=Endozoicomonas numazuensis TaxID=1137799 RepID=UPI001376BCBD
MISKLAGLMLGVLASISYGITEGSGAPERLGFIPGPVIKFNATELMEIDEENNAYGPRIRVVALRFKPDGSELVMVGYANSLGAIPGRMFVQYHNTSALSSNQESVNRLGHEFLELGCPSGLSICFLGGCIACGRGEDLIHWQASPNGYFINQSPIVISLGQFVFATTFILEDAWLAYGHAGLLSLINPANKDDVLPLPGEFSKIVSALDSQGPWLASGDQTGEIRVHNLTNLSDISYVNMTAHNDVVLSLGFSPDSERLLSGGQDKLAGLWLREAGGHFTLIQNMTFDAGVNVVLYHPGGEHYAVAEGPRVHLYEAAKQTRLDTLTMANNMSVVFSLAFHPNGTWLAVGNNQNDLEFYSLGERPEFTFTEQSTLQPTSTVTMVVVSSSAAIDDNQPTSPSP